MSDDDRCNVGLSYRPCDSWKGNTWKATKGVLPFAFLCCYNSKAKSKTPFLQASELFYDWAKQSQPEKALIAQTTQGQLDVAWLNINSNFQRQALFPNAHKISKISPMGTPQKPLNNAADGYQSFGYIFPLRSCFDDTKLDCLFKQLKVARIKGIFYTNKGWFIVNGVDGVIHKSQSTSGATSRVEMIALQNHLPDIFDALNQCKVNHEKEPVYE